MATTKAAKKMLGKKQMKQTTGGAAYIIVETDS